MSKENQEPGAICVPLAQSRSAPRGHIALVPGTQVPLLALDLPDSLRGQVREQVARRQLRDKLGGQGAPVEMRPFELNGQRSAWTRALVADARELKHWRAASGPGCQAVLPDYLALPAAPDVWVIRADASGVQGRLGLQDGFAAENKLAQAMLAQAMLTAPPKAVCLTGEGDSAWLRTLAEAAEVPLVTSFEELEPLGLQAPRALAAGELSLDLRRDPMAARARLRRQVLPWRWPLVAGLAAAALWTGAQWMAIERLTRAAAAERAEALALVREHFIPAGPVLDLQVQVAQALSLRQMGAAQVGAEISPLILLAQAAEVIAASDAVTQEIRQSRAEGLSMRLHLTDFSAADRLVADLRAANLSVDLIESRVSEGVEGVRTELRLTPGPKAGE